MITTIDKQACKTIREALDAALADLGLAGVSCKLGNGRFNPTSVTFKVECSLKNADGTVQSKEITDWPIYCGRWGMSADDLGKRFITSRGDIVTTVGCKPSSPKYPILARNAMGTIHKYTRFGLTRAATGI